jgi:hypothetical protein
MELRGNVFDVGFQLQMRQSRGRIKSSDESPEERVPPGGVEDEEKLSTHLPLPTRRAPVVIRFFILVRLSGNHVLAILKTGWFEPDNASKPEGGMDISVSR